MKVSTQTERCPYCTKRVYHAERVFAEGQYFHPMCLRNLEKEENARHPRTFSISEQIFCNPKEHQGPQEHHIFTCNKCGHVNSGAGFCSKCKALITIS